MFRFLHRQRILVTSLLGLLKGRQSSFVDYHSQLVVRESTDMDNTSSDAELDDWSQRNMDFVDKMNISSDIVDKRLLQIFKIGRKSGAQDEVIRDYYVNGLPNLNEKRIYGDNSERELLNLNDAKFVLPDLGEV